PAAAAACALRLAAGGCRRRHDIRAAGLATLILATLIENSECPVTVRRSPGYPEPGLNHELGQGWRARPVPVRPLPPKTAPRPAGTSGPSDTRDCRRDRAANDGPANRAAGSMSAARPQRQDVQCWYRR